MTASFQIFDFIIEYSYSPIKLITSFRPHYIISVGKLMSRREMISSLKLKLKIGLAVIFQGKHENRPQRN